MMRNLLTILSVVSIGIIAFISCQGDSTFYLADNGVTVKCEDAKIGETGTVNEITYTKRSADQITPSNAENTCTSGITNMKDMFHNEFTFNGDISSWDVGNVTDMSAMFMNTDNFNQDLSNWDVSKVNNMSRMFWNAMDFNQDISSWDVSSVTTMEEMFESADNFDQDISSWDVGNVADMSAMFAGANSFNQDLSGWCVSNITSEPPNFTTSSSALQANYKPNWGTCPN